MGGGAEAERKSFKRRCVSPESLWIGRAVALSASSFFPFSFSLPSHPSADDFQETNRCVPTQGVLTRGPRFRMVAHW